MRVLHVIPSISDKRGGPSAALRQLARQQRLAGLHSAILTTNDDHESNSDLLLGEWTQIDEIPVMAFARRLSKMRWLREHIVSPEALQWLDEELEHWDVVHVHAVFSYLSTGAMRLARRRGHPYICRPLGQLCQWSLKRRSFRKQAYLRAFEKSNLVAASRVHFTSEKEREETGDLGLNLRSMVVPHGIQLPARVRMPNPGSCGPRLLSVSRIDPVKRLELVLRGFAGVVASTPEARLTIAGDGDRDYIRALKKLAADLQVDSRVSFPGWVCGDAKSALLASADLFVSASHTENFGVAVAEALAHGVPALVTDGVALCRDIREFGAGLEIADSPDAIAAMILEAVSDSARYQEMSNNARRLAASRFSWPAIIETLNKHYRSVLDEHAA